MIDYADNYVTSLFLFVTCRWGYDLVDEFDNVFVIFPQCDDGFSGDCGFLSCGGAVT